MIRNLFAALKVKPIKHVAFVTGTKQYLVPFESYGQVIAETPFRESSLRLPRRNFYYTQGDTLFEASQQMGFAWIVHRPHTIIGFAHGNPINNIFRWRWLWPQLAAYFGLESQGPSALPATLDLRMQGAGEKWCEISKANELVESNIDALVSWWHTDGDLGRTAPS